MFDPEDVPPPKGLTDPAAIAHYRSERARYRGQIAMIDDYVGRFVEALLDKDMLDDTRAVASRSLGAH